MRQTCRFRFMLVGLFAWMLSAAVVSAQQNPPPTPNLLALYPSGGQSGQTFAASITEQYQLEEARGLWFSHPGITAKPKMRAPDAYYPEPRRETNEFEIQIAANTPPGVYEVRGISRYGVTNARRFIVSKGKELLEEEDNNSPEKANPLEVGATMNGKFGADYDYFRFTAKKGQTLILSCSAWRIDSRGDAVLTVYNADGRELDQMHDTAGADPVLDFVPPADGDYLVRIHELTYTSSGGRDASPYRLTINSQPWIDFVEPPVVGTTPTKVKIYGRNIGGKPSQRMRNGRPLEVIEKQVVANQLTVANPLELNCAPSEGSLEFRTLTIDTAGGKSNAFPIAVLPGDAIDEAEPNESIEQAAAVTAPAHINAKFDRPGDVDGYRFSAKKGDRFWIEVHSQRLGQPTDISFVVQQLSKTKEGEWKSRDLKTAADIASPAGNFRLPFGSDDASLLFEAPADAEYRVLIRDDYGASEQGVSLCYRLTLRKPQPSFRAVTAPGLFIASNRSNNRTIKPTTCVIQPGSATEILVVAYRSEGFDGRIQVRPESLPPGVTCDPLLLTADQTMGALLLRAKPDAKPWTGVVKVIAEADIAGKKVSRQASNVEVIWDSPRDNRSANACRITTPLLVSIEDVLEHLGRLETPTREFKTARGGKVSIPLKFQRTFDKLTANLTVAAINPPNRVTARTTSVAAGKDAKLELDLLQDVKPGRYTLFLRGEGDIDFEREKELYDEIIADQKRVAELAQQASRDYQKASSAKRSADQKVSSSNSQLASLKRTLASAASAHRQAQTAWEAADKKAKASPSDSTSAASSAAKSKLDQAAEALKKATTAKDAAEKENAELVEAQKKAVEAEQKAKAHSDKGAVLRREADQRLSRGRTMARKVKVRLPVHSEVITLDVAAMPFAYQGDVIASVEVAPGGAHDTAVSIKRLFDFKGDVDVQLTSSTSRLRLEKTVKIKGAEQKAGLKLTVDKNLAPGEYDCQWVFRTRFNNRSLEERLPLRVVVKAK